MDVLLTVSAGGRREYDGNERLRLSNIIEMPCAGSTPEGPSQAEGPSGGGPLARWHKPQFALLVIVDRSADKTSRGL